MAVIVFAITVLIVLFILIRSWKRKRRLENMDQKQGTD
ncbi:FeoB-associated Cys-rich membrane protein [Brevibacillus laterosporus]